MPINQWESVPLPPVLRPTTRVTPMVQKTIEPDLMRELLSNIDMAIASVMESNGHTNSTVQEVKIKSSESWFGKRQEVLIKFKDCP